MIQLYFQSVDDNPLYLSAERWQVFLKSLYLYIVSLWHNNELIRIGVNMLVDSICSCMDIVFLWKHCFNRLAWGHTGELLVYLCICRLSVNIFKHLLWNHWANSFRISHEDSIGCGNESLYKCYWSHDQNGHLPHIRPWKNPNTEQPWCSG